MATHKNMWAVFFTKKMHLPEGLEIAFGMNFVDLLSLSINEAINVSGKIHMKNIYNNEVELQ